ncbi:MAG TPA: hypothetical protein VFT78_15440 [Hanamia sp.]|nr:hypothetical protein [Hanamia sp.]
MTILPEARFYGFAAGLKMFAYSFKGFQLASLFARNIFMIEVILLIAGTASFLLFHHKCYRGNCKKKLNTNSLLPLNRQLRYRSRGGDYPINRCLRYSRKKTINRHKEVSSPKKRVLFTVSINKKPRN